MIKLIFWWRHAINLMTYQGNRGNQRDDHLFRPDDHWFLKATGGCKDHPTSTEGVGVREPCWGILGLDVPVWMRLAMSLGGWRHSLGEPT